MHSMECPNLWLVSKVLRGALVSALLAVAVPSIPPLTRECRCSPASWMSHRSRMFGGSCRLATVRSGARCRMHIDCGDSCYSENGVKSHCTCHSSPTIDGRDQTLGPTVHRWMGSIPHLAGKFIDGFPRVECVGWVARVRQLDGRGSRRVESTLTSPMRSGVTGNMGKF